MRALPLLFCLIACQQSSQEAPLRVAAAADLAAAFEELDPKAVYVFGSSGLLAKQLAEGAPFDVFAAANESFVDQAARSGACQRGQRFARGRLAVWTKAGGAGLEALADERYVRIAIANPEVAPYGKAAKEALVSAGLWERLQPRIVYGENVRQALQLAETGNVEAAIVSDSLVVNAKEAIVVDEAKHAPLIQSVAVCVNGKNRAGGEAFVRRVLSPEGQAVLAKYGFGSAP